MLEQPGIRGTTASEIAASVEAAIRNGELVPGRRLAPIRALAAELGVSPMTVASAYRELRGRGLLVASGRRGTRVAPRPPLPVRARAFVPEGARDLASGNPDPDLLPPLADALARVDTSPRLYAEDGKLPGLVDLAEAQLAADGIAAPAVAIVGGALDGIERVLQAHLRPGDAVAVEDPGFVRAYDLLRPLGLSLEPVALDGAGPRPEELARVLRRGARAVVVTPRAQNPTGAALDEERASELRALLAGREDVLVIEDDHAAGVAGAPAFTLCDRDRPSWATVRSVSKSLGPDLRLAVLAGDAKTVARVEGRQLLGTGWVSGLLQGIVAAFWSDPATRERLERAERLYAERRRFLLEALARHGIHASGRSGLNVWLPVDEEAAVVSALLQRGWAVAAMERWRLESRPAIRITTATLADEDAERLAADVAGALATRTATYSA
ncbi:MAG: aminotransferase class I/II-fold pyridoxal phosphate-dependent enzyme [Actinomycetota bacterium]|nr:aminotransferase class I/II-fold pyridoxal phosphate-dependent enzyme [Actinomycetota bacterium]